MESQLKERAPLLRFVLFKPSTDWMRPTHTGEGNLLSQSTIQILLSSRNTLTDTSRIAFDQISGQPLALSSWCIKLTISEMHQQTLSHTMQQEAGMPPGCPWPRPASHFFIGCLQMYSIRSLTTCSPRYYLGDILKGPVCLFCAGCRQVVISSWKAGGMCIPHKPQEGVTPHVMAHLCVVFPRGCLLSQEWPF